MIKGIGVDMVKHVRIEKILRATYRERFTTKVLSSKEKSALEQIESIEKQTEFLASRWAAKEALVKALDFKELVFSQVEISHNETGGIHFFWNF